MRCLFLSKSFAEVNLLGVNICGRKYLENGVLFLRIDVKILTGYDNR